jgi:ATP-dependent Lon protease
MEIPLFPLPNLVLFPQVAVPLHIFEERYRLLINRCIDHDDIFGLVLLHEDAEHEDETTIHRVGVTARIVQVERLDDGRMNILCAGEDRFRIERFTSSTPYWTGIVEYFEDVPESQDALREVFDTVSVLYTRAIELTSRLKETEIPKVDLPDSALGLSYMVSYVLDLIPARKQELLETTSTVLRLQLLTADLEKVVAQLEEQITRSRLVHKAKTNGDLGKPH